MPDQQAPVNSGDHVIETAIFGPQNLDRLSRGFEALMEGMMNVSIRQIEVTQSLFTDGLSDLHLLTRATTPVAIIEAELEIMRRASQRLTDMAQNVVQDLNRSWVETSSCMQPIAAAKAVRHHGAGMPGKTRP